MQQGRSGSVSIVVCLATAMALTGCGASQPPEPTTPEAPPAAAPAARVPVVRSTAASLTCTPRLGHDQYAAQSCESCHPCGAKATGHDVLWMDQASVGFHAYTANLGLGSCRGCHGTALDGVGGTTTVSCADCHGAAWKTNCVMCHGGTGSQTGAPPKATWGKSGETVRVGTHASHLGATHGLAQPVACSVCHVVPADALAAGHVAGGGIATVTFSGLASANPSFVPAWDRASGTCSNTYCHGASLGGGNAKTPIWTTTDGSQRACGSCHGAPPPAPHSTSTACGGCHDGYTATTVNAAVHVNGTVDVSTTACDSCHGAPPANPRHKTVVGGITTCVECHADTVNAAGAIVVGGKHRNGVADLSANVTCASCHGTPGRVPSPTSFTDEVEAAPPRDTSLNTSSTARGVGAHVAHTNGTRSRNMLCTDCHPWASFMNGFYAHADGVVTVAFAPIAGSSASYTVGTGGSCSSTYCHGNFAGGSGVVASPAWTAAGTLGCTSCHGAPPALSAASHHPRNTACGSCHGAGYSATGVAQATHVDGQVNVSRTGCALCHGDLTQTGVLPASNLAAPGVNAAAADTTGATASSAPGVGAHAAHLSGTRWRATSMACAECHVIPAAADVAHATGAGTNGARATITFGTLATTGAIANASYTGSNTATTGTAAGTCSNTYCHGNFKDGANAAVSWTAGATAAACGSCHGLPPGGTHPTNASACATCHGAGYSTTTVSATAHLNGALEVTGMTCTSCHGTSGQTATQAAPLYAAPPRGSKGETLATTRAVGAHQAHLTGTRLRTAAITCGECHAVPASNAHSNATVELAWGTLAGAASTWNGATCTTYCHGSTLTGRTVAAPSWTGGASQASGCTACHGAPPPAPHSTSTACAGCHAGYTATTVNPATHMNGTKDATGMTCTSCHGTASRAATALNPQLAAAPPVDTTGSSTSRAVGAHMKHLTTATRSSNFACTECHTVPTATNHQNGTKNVTFGTLAKTGGKTPAFNATTAGCSATYCHGNFTNGRTTATTARPDPVWNSTAVVTCNNCHSMPTTRTGRHSKHFSNSFNCSECHSGIATGTSATNAAVTGPTLHVNGAVNVVFAPNLTFTSTGVGTSRRCNGTCHSKNHSSLSW